jgi:hypothetical protein
MEGVVGNAQLSFSVGGNAEYLDPALPPALMPRLRIP